MALTVLTGSQALAPLAGAAPSANSTVVPVQLRAHAASTLSIAGRAARVPFSMRLEDQLLASLHYLPVSFVVGSTTTSTTTTTTTTAGPTTATSDPATTTSTTIDPSTTTTSTTTTTLGAITPAPPITTSILTGSFVWRFTSLPPILRSQWRVGTDNVVLRGALMRFQSDHGLQSTGLMDTVTWRAIVTAAMTRHFDPSPYTYVYVSKTLPQVLKLYVNGHLFFSTLVNTGISVASTENGTYPVYLRFTSTTMSGLNPNGTKYHDTGIPWVSYFHGGDALHGFLRSQYGYPQSLGCVEMTYAHAGIIWPHTPIGTLVTVI